MFLESFKEFGSKKTSLISAFPGTGKSHFFKNSDLKVLDSDSSKFDKSNFPTNYISHIKENLGKADIILISSHLDVRNALVENGLNFTLVYPDKNLKEEYLERYKNRGSDEKFIKLLNDNWNNWISELEEQTGCNHIILKSGQYISDVL